MKDCRDCGYRYHAKVTNDFRCRCPAVLRRLHYAPLYNIERADGECGPEAKYFKSKGDV